MREAAWYIATETSTELKKGGYVQGTVILVLRKRTNGDSGYEDEIAQEVRAEVARQIDTLVGLNQQLKGAGRIENLFEDADLQMAGYPEQPVALYAGAGKSRIIKGGVSTNVLRPKIKQLVADREISLVVATDAACEGLNLQTLGTLINVDLPWNPSRLEQRIGRIKRFGQTRDRVDMANLTYARTVDEKVYRVLSERLRVTSDVFGTMPETIDADWIDDLEALEERLREFTKPKERPDPFRSRYANGLVDAGVQWSEATRVLAREDIAGRLSIGWADQKKSTMG